MFEGFWVYDEVRQYIFRESIMQPKGFIACDAFLFQFLTLLYSLINVISFLFLLSSLYDVLILFVP